MQQALAIFFKYLWTKAVDVLLAAFVNWWLTSQKKKEREQTNQQNVEHDDQVLQNGSLDDIAESGNDILNRRKRP